MRDVFTMRDLARRGATLIAACLLLLATACQNMAPVTRSEGTPTPDRLARVIANHELRVGLSGNQPPLNMKNVAGEIVGLEVDLARALAQSMNLDVRFVQMPFSQLLNALENDAVDMVISGMTITPERNARVAFAGPYMVSGKSLLTRSEEIANADSVAMLDVAGRSYAALDGSTSYALVKDAFPQVLLVGTVDYDEALDLLRKDKVDAVVADFPFCALSIVRYPDEGLLTLAAPFTIEPLGVALPADSPLFVNLVENYLNTLDATGTLVQLKAHWFSRGDWVDELP